MVIFDFTEPPDEISSEREIMQAFLKLWWETYRGRAISVQQVMDLADAQGYLQTFGIRKIETDSAKLLHRRMSRFLTAQTGITRDGLCIEHRYTRNNRKHFQLWASTRKWFSGER